jgi:hypothetical protein
MSEKSGDVEKYLTDSKWVDVVGFDFDDENLRDDFFVKNELAGDGDYVDMYLLERGIQDNVHNARFKGVILLNDHSPDNPKAAGFAFDATKKNFANSQGVEITAKDFQMLIGTLREEDFGLWCVFAPRENDYQEVAVSPDDLIHNPRGKVM